MSNLLRGSGLRYILKRIIYFVSDIIFIIPIFIVALLSRPIKKRIIGIGPLPSINSYGHKKSLELYGYQVETFVDSIWHYTDNFDYMPPRFLREYDTLKFLISYLLFFRGIFKYKALYFYFNGCFFRRNTILMYLEPLIYKLANIKTLVMAYGMDVQDQRITSRLIYKDAYANDYPDFRFYNTEVSKKINLWQKYSDFVLAGCDWIKYLFYWDDIVISHFTVDLEKLKSSNTKKTKSFNKKRPLVIIHAPNHRNLKGTDFIKEKIDDLNRRGFHIKLKILAGVNNQKILNAIDEADIVLDQLIIGWYAVFSIEGMAYSKCTMCYLEEELIEFYSYKKLLDSPPPIVNINLENFTNQIIKYYKNPKLIYLKGKQSRKFVEKHHSFRSTGKKFDEINKFLGI